MRIYTTVFANLFAECVAVNKVNPMGGELKVFGIVPNLPVTDINGVSSFYTEYLGLSVEGFNMGWVAHYESPDGEVHVQLVPRDATAPENSAISVHVGSGVDEAYEEAKRRGYEIVYPLTKEAWAYEDFSSELLTARLSTLRATLSSYGSAAVCDQVRTSAA
jgi:predicted enzyme related to lactoylglutathione lyase